jgi:uncharacterized protein
MVSETRSVARLTGILDRVASLALSAPHILATILVGLAAVAAFGASQIEFDDGMRSIFSSSRAEYETYSNHVENFAQSDTTAVLLITADTGLGEAQLPALRDLVLDLQKIDGIEAMFSIFGVNTINPDAGDVGAFSASDLADLPSVQTAGESVPVGVRSSRSLISADGRQTVMAMPLDDRMQNLADARPVLAEIRQTLARADTGGMRIELTGMVPVRERVIEGIVRDQTLLNGVGALLGFMISLVIFRSFWIALLNGIAPVIALMLSLGAFGLLGFEMNTVRNALPVLILVLATADCIHMTYEFCRKSAETGTLDISIRHILRETGPPCILTSLTTMLAFAGLYYSESPLIQSLSISGILGVGIALATVLFVHPLVFILAWKVGLIRSAFCKARPRNFSAPMTLKTMGGVLRRPLSALAGGIAICIVLVAVFLPLKTDFRYFEFIDAQDEMMIALDQAETISGPVQSIDLPLSSHDPDMPLSGAALDDVRLVHEALEAALPEHSIVSAESLNRALEERGEFPGWNTLTLALAPLPAIVSDSIIARDGSGLLVRVMIPDTDPAEIRALADRVETVAAQAGTNTLDVGQATGLTVLAAELSDTMIRQLTISFLIAALACPLLIGLWFGRWAFGLAAILPNILPILAVGAWLSLMDWNLQFTSALALSIAFGIAVDDTIHVLNRYRIQEKENGEDQTHTIADAMIRIAPALIATTAILSIGIASTLFSAMPTMRYFGELCIAVFVLALIADLFLLPPSLALIQKYSTRQ